jgi:drug/metabolite transporter (DMT)-like permease
VKSIVLWTILIISDTTAQLLLKLGAVKAASSGWLPNSFILFGYSCYLLSFAVWMQLLKDTRLFIALSGATIVYVTIAFGSHVILGEELSSQVIVGTALISSGLFLIGWGRETSKTM